MYDTATFEKALKTCFDGLAGHWGLYFKDLSSGEELSLFQGSAFGQEDRFESASVIKIPIMIEAFRQIEAGIIQRDAVIELRDHHKVPSPAILHYDTEFREGRIAPGELFPESGVLNCLHAGLPLTVMDLIVLMIVISDNTATNMLIDLLGKDAINATLRSLGCQVTALHRKLFEQPASDCPADRRENCISLREMGSLLEALYRNTLVSPEASFEMTAILTNQQFNYKIPFHLPQLPIAHKTGEDAGITNDVAIVYGPRPFLLCLAANETDVPQAERAYQEAARLAAEFAAGGQS